MLFHANNDLDTVIQSGDNSDDDEAIETMDYDGCDACLEDLDYDGSGDDSDSNNGGSGFNLGRFLLIIFIVLLYYSRPSLSDIASLAHTRPPDTESWMPWSPIPEPTRNLQRFLTSLWSPRAFP